MTPKLKGLRLGCCCNCCCRHFPFRWSWTIIWNLVNEPYFLQCRSIGGKDISYLILSGKYIAIALVDQRKLRYGIHVISFFYFSFFFFMHKCHSPLNDTIKIIFWHLCLIFLSSYDQVPYCFLQPKFSFCLFHLLFYWICFCKLNIWTKGFASSFTRMKT